MNSSVGILDLLPNESLIQIFEYLSFEEVAKCRIICKRIDDVCQKILNCGFKRACNQSMMAYKRIKSFLPRRESERRNHALVRHADILSSVETRLSMLSMTYSKYIDLNMCCFIPGRVLDEIFHILRLTMQNCVTLRPLEILQEFRDISSMAIEHFDEHIACDFKKNIERNAVIKMHGNADNMLCSTSSSKSTPSNEIVCGGELLLVRKCLRTSILSPVTAIKLPEKIQSTQPTEWRETETNQKISLNKKNLMIKKLQTSVTTLRKINSIQNKYYGREINHLKRNLNTVKRRLDEMDSKHKELIETIRQYNLEPSQTENTNLNAAGDTTDKKSVDFVDCTSGVVVKSTAIENNALETFSENSDNMRIKRPWISDELQTLVGSKRKRIDGDPK